MPISTTGFFAQQKAIREQAAAAAVKEDYSRTDVVTKSASTAPALLLQSMEFNVCDPKGKPSLTTIQTSVAKPKKTQNMDVPPVLRYHPQRRSLASATTLKRTVRRDDVPTGQIRRRYSPGSLINKVFASSTTEPRPHRSPVTTRSAPREIIFSGKRLSANRTPQGIQIYSTVAQKLKDNKAMVTILDPSTEMGKLHASVSFMRTYDKYYDLIQAWVWMPLFNFLTKADLRIIILLIMKMWFLVLYFGLVLHSERYVYGVVSPVHHHHVHHHGADVDGSDSFSVDSYDSEDPSSFSNELLEYMNYVYDNTTFNPYGHDIPHNATIDNEEVEQKDRKMRERHQSSALYKYTHRMNSLGYKLTHWGQIYRHNGSRLLQPNVLKKTHHANNQPSTKHAPPKTEALNTPMEIVD